VTETKTCMTVGDLLEALEELDDHLPLFCGTSEGVTLRKMFEKNIATGRTRHVVTVEEVENPDRYRDFDYGEDEEERDDQ
jgi:hypothetical protein